jgi:glycosyltransferase involved in cell wall biosynthesis
LGCLAEVKMEKPILSICIPTYNRAEYLEQSIKNIVEDKIFLDTEKVEIVISDNCSCDNTQEICLKYQKMFPDKIKYYRQEQNIFDKNFIQVIKYANGKYAKLHNDRILFRNNRLSEIVEIIENTHTNVVFFSDYETKNNLLEKHDFKNFDDFANHALHMITWIGGLCVERESFLRLESPDRFSHLNFAQIDIMARLSKENGITGVDGKVIDNIPVRSYGGYNPAQVFGENLIIILTNLINEGLLSKKVYNKIIKTVLYRTINVYYFDYFKKHNFEKGGYFRILFKYYKFKPYYYLNYIGCMFRYVRRWICTVSKDDDWRYYKIFCIINLKFKRNKKGVSSV